MFTRIHLKTKTGLFVFFLMIVIFLGGLILFLNLLDLNRIKNQKSNEATLLVRIVAASHERYVEDTKALLFTLADLPEIKTVNKEECIKRMKTLYQSSSLYTDIALFSPTGDTLCNAIGMNNKSVNIFYRPYFQRVLNNRKLVIGGYAIGEMFGKAMAPFAYPILDKTGKVQSVLVAYLDLAWMSLFDDRIYLGDEITVLVIDQDGKLLDCRLNKIECMGEKADKYISVKTIIEKKEGITEGINLDGEKVTFAFSRVWGLPEGENIYLAVATGKKAIVETVRLMFFKSVIIIVFVIMAALGMKFLINNSSWPRTRK